MIHKYKLNELNIVIDTNSGAIHIVEDIVYDLLDYYKTDIAIAEKDLLTQYTKEDIKAAIKEIQILEEKGLLYSRDIYIDSIANMKDRGAVVKALCLHMAHDCNLRCAYCFADDGSYKGKSELMSLEVGKRAIDFLLKNSASRKNLEIDFFGGEPLLNFEVIKELVAYGRQKEKPLNKNIRFTITTNGVLLDKDIIEYVQKNMHNVVLSLDGKKSTNDIMRKTKTKESAYDVIVPKYKEFLETGFDKYYVRGTFTRENLNFCDDVMHLYELGFKNISVEPVVAAKELSYSIKEEDVKIIEKEYEKLATTMLQTKADFDFFHFMIDLEGGPCATKRMVGCGAGTEYLAITPIGDIFPCHQFVGNDKFKLGTLESGITNKSIMEEFKNINIYTKEACKECWGRFYCSGGCVANAYTEKGSLQDIYDIGCKLQLKRTECAIMLKAKEVLQK